MSEDNPKLRGDLRVVPVAGGRGPMVIVQDPLGFQKEPVALGGQALELLALLDGEHSVADIQVEITRRHGVLVTGDQVAAALKKFDDAFLLEGDRYRAARGKLLADFAAAAVLEPASAGTAYPAEPGALGGFLDGVLALAPEEAGPPAGELLAVVAPHIDIRVGMPAYGAAYAHLRGQEFDRVVILGVGHSLAGGAAALTDKDVGTPLGTLSTDREMVAGLRAAGGGALAPDDFAFRGEHSVEFQAVFLRHVLAGDFKVVPVLCGSLDGTLAEHNRAGELPGLGKMLAALKEAVARDGGRTLLVAGVDLSHVGPKFGDGMSSRAIAAESEEHDRALLEALCAPDPGAFWARQRKSEGRFNVCGFGALACLLELLPEGAKGRLLDYRMWHEEPTRSGVSFAAAAFAAKS